MTSMPAIRSLRRNRFLALILALIAMFTSLVIQAAHQVQRPVANGVVNQTYLWAAETTIGGQTNYHKGVDFHASQGTSVYPVANGTVVDMYEGFDNTDHTTLFGNFVLIRHHADYRHWDSTNLPNGALSFSYSMYLHLSHESVIPAIGDQVSTSNVIAQSGNTGNSTGPHLHLQIVLHPDQNVTLNPDSLQSGTRSRNPELWLAPLAGKGTAIGKVTDDNGNPVGNLVVCRIEKSAPTTGYVSARTYSFPWANPDDILHENFGTTDVKPGTYSLYAANYSTGCNGAHVYELGDHTFAAGADTYIGLYPAWLPAVRPTLSWDAQMFIRNHSSERRSVSYTSFLSGGTVVGQRERTSNRRGTAVIDDEQNTAYSGIVVPGQDSSVLLVTRRNGEPAGYTGIVASNTSNDITISPGWERAGRTLYVPLVKKNWVNRWSNIYVTNAGTSATRVYVTYYSNGTGYGGGYFDMEPNDRRVFTPGTSLDDGFYSAVIVNSANQPLAAVVLEGEGSGIGSRPAIYNAFNSGSTVLYAPLVKKNYAGNTTGITLQNINNSDAPFQARYYDMDGKQLCVSPPTPCVPVVISDSIPAYSPYVLYNPSQIPDGFYGSVRINSTGGKPLVGQMSEGNGSGGLRLMSNLATAGTGTIYLPLWYDNYTTGGSWMSGVNVRNVYTAGHTITATWYNQNGDVVLTQSAVLTNSEDTHNFYDTSLTNFIGSVLITSNTGKPIVAVSNVRNWAATTGTDSVMAFNGSNR